MDLNIARKLLFDSHTYFETKSGLVCYTYGHWCRFDDDHMVACVVGYFTPGPTKRIQSSTGRYMEKVIYEGNEGNLDFDERFAHVPSWIKDLLKKYTVIKKETKEHLLVVSYRDVIKIYSPREALEEILSGKSNLDQKRTKAVVRMMKYLKSYGLDQKNVGLYGSLQIHVVHESEVIDIDTLLYGINTYAILLRLTGEQKIKPQIISKYRSINAIPTWKLARDTRDSVAKLFLARNIHADVRIVRKPTKTSPFDFQNLQVAQVSKKYVGIVTDASESLSCPSIFKVKIGKHDYTIATRLYVFIGAARKGDKVEIYGKKLKGSNAILIAEGKTDYIKTIQ